MTKEERKLWFCYLKNHKLHWYKQRVVDNYVLDFYCGSIKLGIELDGSQHYSVEGLEYDKKRTDYLNSQGIIVLRILNTDVNNKFESVCMLIEKYINDLSVS